jgi:hypothetical protein
VRCLNGLRFQSWIMAVNYCFLMRPKLRLGFRATFKWVAAADLRITNVEIGKKPRAILQLRNKGLTPAKITLQLSISIFHKSFPLESLTEFQYPDLPPASTIILLPDSTAISSADAQPEISEEIMEKLHSGDMLLYAYGFSKYEDPRGNTYPPTRFCVFWDPEKKTSVSCPTHNTVQ